jgi:hypothetical protein
MIFSGQGRSAVWRMLLATEKPLAHCTGGLSSTGILPAVLSTHVQAKACAYRPVAIISWPTVYSNSIRNKRACLCSKESDTIAVLRSLPTSLYSLSWKQTHLALGIQIPEGHDTVVTNLNKLQYIAKFYSFWSVTLLSTIEWFDYTVQCDFKLYLYICVPLHVSVSK